MNNLLLLAIVQSLSLLTSAQNDRAPVAAKPVDKLALDVAGAFLGALFPEIEEPQQAQPQPQFRNAIGSRQLALGQPQTAFSGLPQARTGPLLAPTNFGNQAAPQFAQQGLFSAGLNGRTDLPGSYVYPFAAPGSVIRPNARGREAFLLGNNDLFLANAAVRKAQEDEQTRLRQQALLQQQLQQQQQVQRLQQQRQLQQQQQQQQGLLRNRQIQEVLASLPAEDVNLQQLYLQQLLQGAQLYQTNNQQLPPSRSKQRSSFVQNLQPDLTQGGPNVPQQIPAVQNTGLPFILQQGQTEDRNPIALPPLPIRQTPIDNRLSVIKEQKTERPIVKRLQFPGIPKVTSPPLTTTSTPPPTTSTTKERASSRKTDDSDISPELFEGQCQQCVPFEIQKAMGAWTQIYGNSKSMRRIYTTLLSLQGLDLKDERVVTTSFQSTAPSCVGMQAGRPLHNIMSALNLFFRDDTSDRRLHELIGIIQRNMTKGSGNNIALRLETMNLPMCLVRADRGPTGLYSYMILAETAGVNRCRAYHVFGRSSSHFFALHNSAVAEFLQKEVMEDRADAVSVLPFPQLCEVTSK